jgi:hypothetical protein
MTKKKEEENKKEIEGTFKFDQDSKRFHRFKVECGKEIVGTIYIPKTSEGIPEKLILTYSKD